MRFSPGGIAELDATFTDESGSLVDPATVEVDLFNSLGVQLVDNGVPERISVGSYHFEYELAPDVPEGLWRIEWTGTMANGLIAFGTEEFEVATADVVVGTPEGVTITRLRSRLAEVKTIPTGDGSETMFDDEAILDMVAYAENDLDVATFEGWRRKAAHYARLVDISESGADREMSQKYKHAKSMLDFWSKAVGEASESRHTALTGRVVGVPLSLREENPLTLQTPFSGYSEHIRTYPTHRLLIPAILR